MAVYRYENKFIKLPVYGWTVEVVVAEHPLQFAQQKRNFGGNGAAGGTTSAICLYHASDMKTTIIVKPGATVDIITHEVWHSVRYMLEHIHADLENENVAYHMGYLTGEVYKFVQANKSLRTKRKKEKKDDARRRLLPSSKKEELERPSSPTYFGQAEKSAIGGSCDQADGTSAGLSVQDTSISSNGENTRG